MLFGLPMGLEEQMSNHNTKGNLLITAQPKQVEVAVYLYSKRKRTLLTKEARKANRESDRNQGVNGRVFT